MEHGGHGASVGCGRSPTSSRHICARSGHGVPALARMSHVHAPRPHAAQSSRSNTATAAPPPDEPDEALWDTTRVPSQIDPPTVRDGWREGRVVALSMWLKALHATSTRRARCAGPLRDGSLLSCSCDPSGGTGQGHRRSRLRGETARRLHEPITSYSQADCSLLTSLEETRSHRPAPGACTVFGATCRYAGEGVLSRTRTVCSDPLASSTFANAAGDGPLVAAMSLCGRQPHRSSNPAWLRIP